MRTTRVPEALPPPPCWWCGAPADSREHKYKRTDLTRQYGPGPWVGDHRPRRVVDDGSTGSLTTGPRSREFTFSQTLCRRCNNLKSQTFDRAYDAFMDAVLADVPQRGHRHRINLREIYGSDWRPAANDLFRYFCKHIGCRLAQPDNEVALVVPPDLIAYLDGGPAPPSVAAELVLDRNLLAVARVFAAGGAPTAVAHTGPLLAWPSSSGTETVAARSFVGNGWVRLDWSVGLRPPAHPFSDECLVPRRSGSRGVVARLALREARIRLGLKS